MTLNNKTPDYRHGKQPLLRLLSPRQPGCLRMRKIRGFASSRHREFALMEGGLTQQHQTALRGDLKAINKISLEAFSYTILIRFTRYITGLF